MGELYSVLAQRNAQVKIKPVNCCSLLFEDSYDKIQTG